LNIETVELYKFIGNKEYIIGFLGTKKWHLEVM